MLKLLRSNTRSIPYLPIIVDVARRPKGTSGEYPFEGCLNRLTNANTDINDFLLTIQNDSELYEDYNYSKTNGLDPARYVQNLFYRYYNQTENNAKLRLSLIADIATQESDDEDDLSNRGERVSDIAIEEVNIKFLCIKYIKVLVILSYIYGIDLFPIVLSFISETKFQKDNYYYDLGKCINNGLEIRYLFKNNQRPVNHDLDQRRDEYSSLNRQFRRKSETYRYRGKYLKNICYWFDNIEKFLIKYNLIWDIYTAMDSSLVKAGISMTEEDLDYKELYVDTDELIYNAVDNIVTITDNILSGEINVGPTLQDIITSGVYEENIRSIVDNFCPDYIEGSVLDYDSNGIATVDGKIAILAINDNFQRDSKTGSLFRASKSNLADRSEYSQQAINQLRSGSFAIVNRNGIMYYQLVNSTSGWGIADSKIVSTGRIKEPTIYSSD